MPPIDRELIETLGRWHEQTLTTDELLAWVATCWPCADAPASQLHTHSPAVTEILAALDLLAVHLLTPADVPAMLLLLDPAPADTATAIDSFRAYVARIDRRERSRRLRRDPRYRPFCL